ncbi:MAG: protein-glutamate O-methyltransferase [Alphaproteobacteria bacterium]|nr:protein-glutamate O-methyltransferase [Alphaproteobacteria bacterium]
MKPDSFAFLSKWLYERTGLVLGPDKLYLVESRLSPVARKFNLAGLDAIVVEIKSGRGGEFATEVSDAMMTNESFFYRDVKPFDQFKDLVLPRMMQARASVRRLRIWSAAASTGQEPYTLAMIIKEMDAKLAGWKIEIVGTDISREALDRAKAGLYTQFEVQRGLPIQMLLKYFKQQGDRWQIADSIKQMVQLREFNLLTDPASLGQFDVVFCRNVLIYFDQPTKAAVLARIAKQMPNDGILYLGGAETVLGVTDKFAPLPGQRGIYGVAAGLAAAPAPVAARA